MSNLSVDRYFPASAPGQIQIDAPKTDVVNSVPGQPNQPGQAEPKLADASPRLQAMLKKCVKLEGGVLLLQRTDLRQRLQEVGFIPARGAQSSAQKKLIAAGDKVASAMKALDKLGCAAFMVAAPSNSAKKALDKVIDSLMNLEQAVDTLADSITDDTPLAARMQTALEGIRNACASRISETVTLTSALHALGELGDTNPNGLEQTSFALKAADVHNKSLTQVMSEMALNMHGMDKTLADLSGDAEQLFSRADQLEKNNNTVSLTEFQHEATSLREALGGLRAKAATLSDSAELATLNDALERMETKLTSLCNDRGSRALQSMAKAMFSSWPADLHARFNMEPNKYFSDMEKFYHDLSAHLFQALETNDGGVALANCLDKLELARASVGKIMSTLRESYAQKLARDDTAYDHDRDLREQINMLEEHVLGCNNNLYKLEKKQLEDSYRRIHNGNDTLRLDLLSTVLTSPHVGVSTLVEAQLRGIPARYLELGTNDNLLSGSKALSSGACNTVQLCTYQDKQGKLQRVFKPEAEGARAFAHMRAVTQMKVNFGESHLVELNIASCIAADAIGCGDVLAKSRIGVHHDEFGLFMETAPGKSAAEFAKSRSLSKLKKSRGNNELYHKACGNLQRELNKLEWADLLSGQLDRHRANYFIDLNTKTGDVKVTGIDNDMAFSHVPILAGVITLPRQDVEVFAPRLVDNNPSDVVEVKFSELTGSEMVIVRLFLGINHANKPKYIDINVYNKLIHIDTDAYRTELLDCLHDQKAVDVAMQRLASAQELARTLHANGKVIDDTVWSNPAMLEEARNTYKETIALHPLDTKKTGNEKMRLLTKGFFVRDIVKDMK